MFHREIETGLILEPYSDRDAAELFAAVERNRGYLSTWLRWVRRVHSPEDAVTFIRDGNRRYAEDDGVTCAVKLNGKLIGGITLLSRDTTNNHAPLAYWLDEGCNGHGYITRAAREVVDHGFRDLGLHKLYIYCSSANARSAAVARRMGFVLEATTRKSMLIDGVFHDEFIFGLLRSEWKSACEAEAASHV